MRPTPQMIVPDVPVPRSRGSSDSSSGSSGNTDEADIADIVSKMSGIRFSHTQAAPKRPF